MSIRFSEIATLCCLLAGIHFANGVFAQQNSSSTADTARYALYRRLPLWKDMMNDSAANFFEVQKAFELYWAGKEMPLEENDVIGESHRIKSTIINRIFNAKELEEQKERDALSFDCKKYRWWVIQTEPFIHDDGSIMTTEERLKIWKNQYEELNQSGK